MGGAVGTGGGTKNSNPCRVHVRISGSHLLDHGYMVFKRAAQISIRELMESTRASGRASSVDHHYNEAELRD